MEWEGERDGMGTCLSDPSDPSLRREGGRERKKKEKESGKKRVRKGKRERERDRDRERELKPIKIYNISNKRCASINI